MFIKGKNPIIALFVWNQRWRREHSTNDVCLRSYKMCPQSTYLPATVPFYSAHGYPTLVHFMEHAIKQKKNRVYSGINIKSGKPKAHYTKMRRRRFMYFRSHLLSHVPHLMNVYLLFPQSPELIVSIKDPFFLSGIFTHFTFIFPD